MVPATNFTSGFASLRYRGIWAAFDRERFRIGQHNIVQASDLKSKLELLNISCNFNTVVSFNAVNIYLSITFAMVEHAVTYYARGFPRDMEALIRICLLFISYSMGHTLITFRGEYF